jgi:hypothetical protein
MITVLAKGKHVPSVCANNHVASPANNVRDLHDSRIRVLFYAAGMNRRLPAILFLFGITGCASAPLPDQGFTSAIGRECLVVLRGDAAGAVGGGDTSSEQTDIAMLYFHGRIKSIDNKWLVLHMASGFDYYIPREAILVASVANK